MYEYVLSLNSNGCGNRHLPHSTAKKLTGRLLHRGAMKKGFWGEFHWARTCEHGGVRAVGSLPSAGKINRNLDKVNRAGHPARSSLRPSGY